MKAFAHLELVLLLGLFCTTGMAQRSTQVQHLLPEDGLSYRWATAVQQDSLGLIWVSTYDGLNSYDGHRFTVYRPELVDSASARTVNNFMDVICDQEGKLWVATEGGQWFRFDPVKEELQLARMVMTTSSDTLKLLQLIKSPDGQLWGIGQQEEALVLARWQQGMSFERITDFASSLIKLGQVLYADENRLWIFTEDSYLLFNVQEKTVQEFPFRELIDGAIARPHLPIDAQGRFWFPSGDSWTSFPLPALLAEDDWKTFMVDNTGGSL